MMIHNKDIEDPGNLQVCGYGNVYGQLRSEYRSTFTQQFFIILYKEITMQMQGIIHIA